MSLRIATPSDATELIDMIVTMHTEAKFPIPPLDMDKVSGAISKAIQTGIVLVATKDKKIIGSIGGIVAEDWFSKNKVLGDLWFYVNKEERSSNTAVFLIKHFISAAKKAKLTVRLGHVYFGDLERKDKFYKKLGLTLIGQTYSE